MCILPTDRVETMARATVDQHMPTTRSSGAIESAKTTLGYLTGVNNQSYIRLRHNIEAILIHHDVHGLSQAGEKKTNEILNEITDHKDFRDKRSIFSSDKGRAALKLIIADVGKKMRSQIKKAAQEQKVTSSPLSKRRFSKV